MDPAWFGDTADFEVNTSKQLHLASSGVDTSVLYTSNATVNDAEWNFWLHYTFSPSDNNHARIYLLSDQYNLKGMLNGYFVRYGENGANDGVDLWRQDGNTFTKIIDGVPNPNAAATNQNVRVRVLRSASGGWQLFADYYGGLAYQAVGNATDNTYANTVLFGVYCKYTASNSSGFYVDDVYAGDIIVDNAAPSVTAVYALSADTVDVIFSEPVAQNTATVLQHYDLENVGQPSAVLYSASAPDRVRLVLPDPLPAGVFHEINIASVKDMAGNEMLPFHGSVLFYKPQPFDVLVSEIMADPVPTVGLVDAEYVELYNTKNFPVYISGWKIQCGNTVRTIPSGMIPPDSFIVLTVDPLPAFYSILNAVPLPSFPALPNAGGTVSLLAPSGEIVHRVAYHSSWYHDPHKNDGGWALEMVNPHLRCNDAGNWQACANNVGGTPGARNSVFDTQPVNFVVESVEAVSVHELHIRFNQWPDTVLLSPNLFSVNGGLGAPASVQRFSDRNFLLYFLEPFLSSATYEVAVSPGLKNCAGENITGSLVHPFVFYEVRQNDVVISEIMADESPSQGLPGFEYVELYNRSDVPIRLGNWTFSAGNSEAVLPDYLLAPHAYVALSEPDAAASFSVGMLGVPSFPTLGNSESVLQLKNKNGQLVHTVSYDDGWYIPAVKGEGGWSLEMADVNNPCAGIENWAASTHTDGGTPGSENSVSRDNADAQKPFPMRVGIPAPDSLLLYFSEPLRRKGISAQQFNITNGVGMPLFAMLEEPGWTTVLLKLAHALQPGTAYEIIFTDSIADCVGNTVEVKHPLRFRLPEPVASGDVVFNEVLFDAKGNGNDYVEIVNRSQKAIELRDLYICNYDSATKQFTDVYDMATRSAVCMPGGYVLFSKDRTDVYKNYYCENPAAFWDLRQMPALNDSGGSMALAGPDLQMLDAFTFTDKFHFPLLENPEGVSLERISVNLPTQSSQNWTSAAASVGYGTPGYVNSQQGAALESDGTITVQPEIFSPDQDGFDDVLSIAYEFENAGNVLHINIYDEAGRLIKKLVKGEYCGHTGQYIWAGGTETGLRPAVGIYVLVAEWFNAAGEKGRAKKVFVLATRL